MTVPVRVAIMFEGVSAVLVSSEFVVPPDFSLRCDRFLLISPDGTSTRYDRGGVLVPQFFQAPDH